MSSINRNQKQQAYLFFFPAAAIYSALAIPLSVYAMTTTTTWLPGLQGMSHAHEMLFGFALALVAGYTLGPMQIRALITLLTLWLCARLAYINFPTSLITQLLNITFVLVLAIYIVPKFRVAKKWRNRVLSPLLLCICLAPVLYAYLIYKADYVAGRILLMQAVLQFALLMAFMGGRIIAAGSTAGIERYGQKSAGRMQAQLEAAMIILLIGAVFLLLFVETYTVAAISVILAGTILLGRLFRWHLWYCKKQLDLISLGIGYAWLAIGLICIGISMLLDQYTTEAIHIITVGALGSLSTGVMARLYFQRQRRQPPINIIVTITLLIAVATSSRISAGIIPDNFLLLLWTAASCWSLAYLLLTIYLLSKISNEK